MHGHHKLSTPPVIRKHGLSLAGGVHLWGIPGWRLAFLAVACVSIMVGLLNLAVGVDPVPPQQRDKLHVSVLLQQMASFLRLPTFGLIVIQAGHRLTCFGNARISMPLNKVVSSSAAACLLLAAWLTLVSAVQICLCLHLAELLQAPEALRLLHCFVQVLEDVRTG